MTNTPPIVNADIVNANSASYLLIDIRTSNAYSSGHIPGAINVQPNDIINYLNGKNLNSYTRIVLIDNDGQSSSYFTSLLRFYGFDSVYSLDFGMSQWNGAFANIWLNSLKQTLIPSDVDDPYTKNGLSNLPTINLSNLGTTIEEQTQNRVSQIVTEGFNQGSQILNLDFSESFSDYYLICYGKYQLYNSDIPLVGTIALPASFLYIPGIHLLSTSGLQTLPLSKKIIIYSVSGINSAMIVAYLRILGYDAATLDKGACTFTYNYLLQRSNDWAPFLFLQQNIKNYAYNTGPNP